MTYSELECLTYLNLLRKLIKTSRLIKFQMFIACPLLHMYDVSEPLFIPFVSASSFLFTESLYACSAGCRVWLIMRTKASTGRKRTNERTKKITLRRRMSQQLAATTAVMYVVRRVSNLVFYFTPSQPAQLSN